MCSLLFTYRKLSLTRRQNELNFNSMKLSQEKQNIVDQIGDLQQSISAAKNMMSIFGQMDTSKLQNIFSSECYGGDGKLKVDEAVAKQRYMEMFTQQQEITAANSMRNSIFESAMQSKMAHLNSIGTSIDMKIKTNDTQMAQVSAELQKVESAEQKSIEQGTPKFGLN